MNNKKFENSQNIYISDTEIQDMKNKKLYSESGKYFYLFYEDMIYRGKIKDLK